MDKEDFEFFFKDLKLHLLNDEKLLKSNTKHNFITNATKSTKEFVKKKYKDSKFKMLNRDQVKTSTEILAINYGDDNPLVFVFFEKSFSLYILDEHLVDIFEEGLYEYPKFEWLNRGNWKIKSLEKNLESLNFLLDDVYIIYSGG